MSLVLRGGTLVDGTGADPVEGATVGVRDGRIAARGRGRQSTKGAEVIDLDGLTLLPGLIDAHTHLGGVFGGESLSSLAELAAEIFKNVEGALDAGFTTCREVGGVDNGVVRAIDRGLLRGPRILHSGSVLCQSGGHGDFRGQFDDEHPTPLPGLTCFATPADGVDGVRRAARESFRRGASQLKVCVTGGVVSLHDNLSDTQFSVPELRAMVEEAEARGTYVTAHAHNEQGVRNGLAAGVACFEHGTAIREELAKEIAAAGAAVVPTLTVAHTFLANFDSWGLPAEIADRIQGVEQGMAEATRHCLDAGVLVGLGSDLIGANQIGRGLEISLRAEIQDPLEAITAATGINAQVLRIADDVGTIEAGKAADLIAVKGDPLGNPRVLADPDNVVLVIKSGAIAKDLRRA